MTLAKNWEHGSHFHLLTSWPSTVSPMPWGDNHSLYGSGRQALRALMEYGRANRGWRRLWVPSYFCQACIFCFTPLMEVKLYPDHPWESGPQLDKIEPKPGDVLFVTNLFGLRAKPDMGALDRSQMEVVEDHFHDPCSKWAWTSDADWCVVHLRKTLPVPDGGLLWSPAGHPLPPALPVTPEHQVVALEKLAAMALKTLYLEDYPIEKDNFRGLAVSGEDSLRTGCAIGKVSGMTSWSANVFPTFPIEIWRERRRRNHGIVSAGLADLPWVKVLQPVTDADTCPYAAILVVDSPERRSHLSQKLIAARIYPTILWPFEESATKEIPQVDIDFSQRMLTIHCDLRYTEADMEYVIALIRKYGEEYSD
ncbi:MAG: hypothetical protein JRI57_07840 [Deltaproteobacteria bacterium]|nr:hypothetical protein [Deltaproteobacteria bacterium]MBW1952457.1 hypothetical protein [Deltaproteobacteria bacterium]